MRLFLATSGLSVLLCGACGSGSESPGAAGSSGNGGSNAQAAGGTSAGATSAMAGSATSGSGGSSVMGTSGSGNAGSAGKNGAGGTGQGGAASIGASGLPTPPGAADVPKPAGAAANLKVLPWAGFKAAVSYTFDDSQPSQFEHWAELKGTGVPVTYFITSSNNYIADYDKILKELAAGGGEIGNHTANHCNFDLTGCTAPLASAGAEMDECSKYITTNLGQPDTLTIAYPYGDSGYEPDSKTRFFLARGTGGGMVAPGDNTDAFNLPCVAAAGGEGAEVFSGNVDDAQSQGKWLIFLFHSLGPTANAWYATVDVSAVTGSIDHAKSLNDVWIDSMASVGAYWLGQKLLASAGPSWSWSLPTHFPAGKYLRVTVDGGTLKQGETVLAWDAHGYYEVALDAGALSWSP